MLTRRALLVSTLIAPVALAGATSPQAAASPPPVDEGRRSWFVDLDGWIIPGADRDAIVHGGSATATSGQRCTARPGARRRGVR